MKYFLYNKNELNKEILVNDEVIHFLTKNGLPIVENPKREKQIVDENGDLPFSYPKSEKKTLVSVSSFYPSTTKNLVYKMRFLEIGTFELNDENKICIDTSTYNIVKYNPKMDRFILINKDIFSFTLFLQKLSFLNLEIVNINDYKEIIKELKLVDKEVIEDLNGYWGYNILTFDVVFE